MDINEHIDEVLRWQRKKSKYHEKSDLMLEHGRVRDDLMWTTSTGKNMTLPEMDTNHLKNAMAKIQRGDHKEREHMFETLKMEKIYREVYSLDKIKLKKNEQPKRRTLRSITLRDIKV